MPEERQADYLDGIDTAAEWFPEWYDVPRRVRLPRLDIPAHEAWKQAWRRGLVSDIDMAWYTMLINRHPCSWLGWLKGM